MSPFRLRPLAALLLLPAMTLAQPLRKGDAPAISAAHTDQLLVQLADGPLAPAVRQLQATELSRLSTLAGQRLNLRRRPDAGGRAVLQLARAVSTPEAEALAARLAADPAIAAAAPDYLRKRSDGLVICLGSCPSPVSPVVPVIPNDPDYALQWNLQPAGSLLDGNTVTGSNLPPAWGITTGQTATVIAILDTGILPHADLAGRVLPGYDFISSAFIANDGDGRDNDATDAGDWVAARDDSNPICSGEPEAPSSWHGTGVAGMAAAGGNNGLWMAGINWQARLLPVRVLGKCGGYDSDILDAMRWAAGLPVAGVPDNPHPAHVINMSLGSASSCSIFYRDMISQLAARGVMVVAATGNEYRSSTLNAPANCSGVVAVTAHNADGLSAIYANVGPNTAISAPGGDVGTAPDGSATGLGLLVSTLSNDGSTTAGNDNRIERSGTSLATPHVAGTLALLRGLLPAADATRLRRFITETARPHPAGSWCTLGTAGSNSYCGSGLLDAGAALGAAHSALGSNRLPAPSGNMALAGKAGSALNKRLQATDADGDSVRFIPVSGPDGVFLSGSGQVLWSNPVAGMHELRFRLHDGLQQTGEFSASVSISAAGSGGAGGSGGGSTGPWLLVLLALGALRRRRSVRL